MPPPPPLHKNHLKVGTFFISILFVLMKLIIVKMGTGKL